jgi:hypothetical protein
VQFHQGHTESKDVPGGATLGSQVDLWGQIRETPDNLPTPCQGASHGPSTKSEICQKHLSRGIPEQVSWFDIPMDNALLVEVVEGAEDANSNM